MMLASGEGLTVGNDDSRRGEEGVELLLGGDVNQRRHLDEGDI